MNPFIWSAIGQAGTVYTDAMQRLGEQQQQKQQQDLQNQIAGEELKLRQQNLVIAAQLGKQRQEEHELEMDSGLLQQHAAARERALKARYDNNESEYEDAVAEAARLWGQMGSLARQKALAIPGDFKPIVQPSPGQFRGAAGALESMGVKPSEEFAQASMGEQYPAVKAWLAGGMGQGPPAVPSVSQPTPALPTPEPLQMGRPPVGVQLRGPVPSPMLQLPSPTSIPSPPAPMLGERRLTQETPGVLAERERAKNRPSRAWEFILQLAEFGVTLAEYRADPEAGANYLATLASAAGAPDLTADVFLPVLKSIKPWKAKEEATAKTAERRVDEAIAFHKASMAFKEKQLSWQKVYQSAMIAQGQQRIAVSKESLALSRLSQHSLEAYRLATLGIRGEEERRKAMKFRADMRGLEGRYTVTAEQAERGSETQKSMKEAAIAYGKIADDLDKALKQEKEGLVEDQPSKGEPGAGKQGATEKIGGITFRQPGAPTTSGEASQWVIEALRKGGPRAEAIQAAKNPPYNHTDLEIYTVAHSPR